MCLTHRHDFGLRKDKSNITDPMGAGMTEEEAQALWDDMARIFDNDIAPHMEFRKEDGRRKQHR